MTDNSVRRALQPEDYWRGIVLFGRNVQSYKFALARALLELRPDAGDLLKLEDLAPVYARHLVDHLKLSDKQGTAASSTFLDSCRGFISGGLSQSQLVDKTVQLGFNNVIDAFHKVQHEDVPLRFFNDERKTANGIRITDGFSQLAERPVFSNLEPEAEARWRLVETAWELKVSRSLLAVHHDEDTEELFVIDRERKRKSVTSSRDALSGYQKGHCFYCFDLIQLGENSELLPDVDHFLPHMLKEHGFKGLDGVWNLVLSCRECNRGSGGKFAALPGEALLKRLHERNEFLIQSNHPLKETLISQTGKDMPTRRDFLKHVYSEAWPILIHRWNPIAKQEPLF